MYLFLIDVTQQELFEWYVAAGTAWFARLEITVLSTLTFRAHLGALSALFQNFERVILTNFQALSNMFLWYGHITPLNVP